MFPIACALRPGSCGISATAVIAGLEATISSSSSDHGTALDISHLRGFQLIEPDVQAESPAEDGEQPLVPVEQRGDRRDLPGPARECHSLVHADSDKGDRRPLLYHSQGLVKRGLLHRVYLFQRFGGS